MAIIEISKEEFESFNINRIEMLPEVAWFRDEKRNIIGTIFYDRVDDTFGSAILGRDVDGMFKYIDGDTVIDVLKPKLATIFKMKRIENTKISIFSQDDDGWRHLLHYFDYQIKLSVKMREISSLIHFTKIDNVPGILEHGLLGRETIIQKEINSAFNDQYRYDGQTDAVCASISFPNYKMFYGLQKSHPEQDWVILRLDARILWELPCAFSITNAAKKSVTSIPIEERKGIKAFSKMFEDIQPHIKRSNLNIPDNFCTDPQAEVLILEPVSPHYILDINVNDEDSIYDIDRMGEIFEPYLDSFKIQHDKELFTYRQDYEHWQKD